MNMNIARISWIGLLMLAMSAGSIEAAELMQNGGFETGDLSSWTQQWTPGESGSVVTTSAARTPRYGLWMYTANASPLEAFSYIYQDVPTVPDEVVVASAYIATPGGGAG
jgi:hypothetical protein